MAIGLTDPFELRDQARDGLPKADSPQANSKYGAEPAIVDGVRFASKAEACGGSAMSSSYYEHKKTAPRVTMRCGFCGKEMECRATRIRRYCSRACMGQASRSKKRWNDPEWIARRAQKERYCLQCGKLITGSGVFFCSRACLFASYPGTWIEVACSYCGKLLRKKRYLTVERGHKNLYCDKRCEAAHRTFGANEELRGRRNDGGYIDVKVDGRYRLLHRVIMERRIGRPLVTNEVVHHLNGIRDDNRIENLCLVTPSTHPQRTLVNLLQERIRELESELSKVREPANGG